MDSVVTPLSLMNFSEFLKTESDNFREWNGGKPGWLQRVGIYIPDLRAASRTVVPSGTSIWVLSMVRRSTILDFRFELLYIKRDKTVHFIVHSLWFLVLVKLVFSFSFLVH